MEERKNSGYGSSPSSDLAIRRSNTVVMDNFQRIMRNNAEWSHETIRKDPQFFERLVEIQTPEYLWIGCSDSRVPANEIVGLLPGQLFVHRNVANQAPLSDINCLAVVQYAVQYLKVKDIIVAGHYGCGGIRAAFSKRDYGALQAWLSHVRDLRARYRKQLKGSDKENENLLVQLNVKQQVYNIARIPSVQKAWLKGEPLRIHGLVYRLEDGILHDLGLTLNKLSQLPEQFRLVEENSPKTH